MLLVSLNIWMAFFLDYIYLFINEVTNFIAFSSIFFPYFIKPSLIIRYVYASLNKYPCC